jgi:AcrR family transcriptional regulator
VGTALPSSRIHERRTQSERRAATRAALVEATIACLVDLGYANTTTRDIAERAGVTPGALQHHFRAKVELLVEARRRISVEIVEGMVGDRALLELPLLERSEELLDRMWLLYRGPLFQAGMELWIAARTDPQLREKLIEVQRFGGESIAAGTALLFPEIADQASAIQLMATVDATLRGLAVLSFVNDADADRAWPWTRANLLALGAPLRATAPKQR